MGAVLKQTLDAELGRKPVSHVGDQPYAKLTYKYLIEVHPHLSPDHDEPFHYSLDEEEFVSVYSYRGYTFTKTGHLRTATQPQAKTAANFEVLV